MGQLLTLMVFGDAITVDNDKDEDEIGAATPGPPGPGIHDPEMSCIRVSEAADGEQQDDESGADGAGQRDGEFRHDLSALESWSCVVHRHRTGLAGDVRHPKDSSDDGWDPGGQRVGDEDGSQRQLLDIMNIADREATLSALRQYLAATISRVSAQAVVSKADDARRAGAQTGASVTTGAERVAFDGAENDVERRSTSGYNSQHDSRVTPGYTSRTTDNSECEDSTGNRHSCYTSTTAAQQRSVSSAGPSYVSGRFTGTSTSLAQLREAADRDCGSKVEVRSDSTVSRRSDASGSQRSLNSDKRTSTQDDDSLRSSATPVEHRPTPHTATAESASLTDTDFPTSEHGSVTSVTGQFRLRSTVVPASQRQDFGTSRPPVKRKGESHSEQDEVDAGDDDDVSRRRPPADDRGGGTVEQ